MSKKTDWISCYIFHNIPFEKVLIELVKPILDILKKDKLIEKSFFIRYWENGPHIRLRVLPIKNKIKIEKLIKSFIEDYFKFIGNETEYSIKFNNYIQEFSRYGGDEAMKIAENQFQNSSEMVLTCINNDYNNWDYSMAISIAIQSHIIFVKKMLSSIDDSKMFFNLIYKNWIQYSIKLNQKKEITTEEIIKVNSLFKNSYEKQKGNINFITKKLWFEEELEKSWLIDWSSKCEKISRQIKETNNPFSLKGVIFENNLKLSNEKQALFVIYDSYVHMTNNRLGIHLRDESFIAFLVLKGLESLKQL
jgi:thiopeptide-type bacteriocin biosynthesis protein